MSDIRKEQIADLYYRSGSIKFGAFPLSVHMDDPSLPHSPWYMHYPKPDEPGALLLPQLFELVGQQFHEMSEAQKPPLRPARIAGLPNGAHPLAEAYARQYPGYPHNLLKFLKVQHDKERTQFSEPIGNYEYGDALAPCEDHISAARNNLLFIAHARRCGFIVTRLLVVVDRQQGASTNLAAQGVELLSIFTGDEMLEFGVAEGHITQTIFDDVQAYRTENEYCLLG